MSHDWRAVGAAVFPPCSQTSLPSHPNLFSLILGGQKFLNAILHLSCSGGTLHSFIKTVVRGCSLSTKHPDLQLILVCDLP